MKRISAFFLALMLCVTLVSCGDEKKEIDPDDEKITTGETVSKDTSNVDEGTAEDPMQTAEPEESTPTDTTEDITAEPEEIIPDPAFAPIAGKWAATLDSEASLMAIGMTAEELEAQAGVENVVELLEGNTLTRYMTIYEDGSCEMLLKGEDATAFFADMYYSIYGIEAEFTQALEDEEYEMELEFNGEEAVIDGNIFTYNSVTLEGKIDGIHYVFERV